VACERGDPSLRVGVAQCDGRVGLICKDGGRGVWVALRIGRAGSAMCVSVLNRVGGSILVGMALGANALRWRPPTVLRVPLCSMAQSDRSSGRNVALVMGGERLIVDACCWSR